MPTRAVRLGEKNIAMTNAARAMPAATANPTCCRIEFPARISDANVLTETNRQPRARAALTQPRVWCRDTPPGDTAAFFGDRLERPPVRQMHGHAIDRNSLVSTRNIYNPL